MKALLKNKKFHIITADILLLPALFLLEKLSDIMLTKTSETCLFLRLGGKCVACGGTHFVNTLLNGKFAEAFGHNAFLFVLTVILAISFILLNLSVLFKLKFAKTILSKVYSVPGVIVGTAGLVVFFVARIAPMFVYVFTLLSEHLSP